MSGTKSFSWRESLCPLAAGLLGGAVSTTLLLPLDVIKVRMQVHEDTSSASNRKKSANHPSAPTTKRLNSFRVVRGILRHEGWRGLYQGLSPAVVGASIAWGGYFFFYEGFKQQLAHYYQYRCYNDNARDVPPPPVILSSIDNFGLACAAGAVMVFITNPIWLIKTRMQLQMKETAKKYGARKEPYLGLFDALRTIVREEGFWALYKGTVPALLLTSHGGVQFVVYEYLKLYFDFKRIPRNVDGGVKQPVMERLQQSLGYLSMGAVAKM
jgi:solute carrier family 25 folate transporter 32